MRLAAPHLWLLVILPTDCGTLWRVVYHFDLPGRPPATFSLPDSVQDGPYTLVRIARDPRAEHMCADRATRENVYAYRLRENNKQRVAVYVRLNRGETSSLEVAYGYLGSDGIARRESKPDTELEERLKPEVEVAARLVMKGASVSPTLPARMERLQSVEEEEQWCARVVDDSSTAKP